jgi:hypothetical protein
MGNYYYNNIEEDNEITLNGLAVTKYWELKNLSLLLVRWWVGGLNYILDSAGGISGNGAPLFLFF